jgi:ABC-type molybdenum transport system ATPase subunit/photorepair protein PhrA
MSVIIEDLSFTYEKKQVLDNISLTVQTVKTWVSSASAEAGKALC